MRNKFFLFCFFLFSVCSLYSQSFKAGLVAGLDASHLVGVSTGYRHAGFTLGGVINTNFSKTNSLQFEILYVQKGSLIPPDSANNNSYYKLSMDWVEVPLIFRHRIRFKSSGKTINEHFAYEIGPSFGVRARLKQTGYLFDPSGNLLDGAYNTSQFRSLELAINIGFTYTVNKNLMLIFRYSNSIIPVTKNDIRFNTFIFYSAFLGDNNVLSFTLRYMLGGKEESE